MEQQAQATPQTQPAAQGQATPNRPVVVVPFDTRDELIASMSMVLDARLHRPGEVTLPNRGVGAQRLANLENVARLGAADNFAVTLLALQQIPRFSPSGEDNAIETSARYMNDALAVPAGTGYYYSCLQTEDASLNGCRITPVTEYEQRVVLAPQPGRLPTANMVPNRTIPINTASAFIVGFTDSFVNPQRYLPTGPDGTRQNLTPAQNAARVRDAVATENPGVNPDAALRATAELCLENSTSVEIRQCAIAGARSGVIFSGDNPEIQSRYTRPPIVASAPAQPRQ